MNKITQQRLADLSDLSKSYVSQLENDRVHSGSGGKIRPTEETVAMLAEALNADENEGRLAAGYAPKQPINIQEEKSEYDPLQIPILHEKNKGVLETSIDINLEVRDLLNELNRKMDKLLKKSEER